MQIKRRFVRWDVDRPAKVKLEGAEAFMPCSINDISLMGMSISLTLKLELDKFLKLALAISEDFVLNVEVWIAWHRAASGVHTYGLYFSQIAEKDKENIYRFIQTHCKQELAKTWWQDVDAKIMVEDREEEGTEEMEDKRVFQRFAIKFPLRFFDANSGKEGAAQTYDVSAKGIRCITNEVLPPKTALELWLDVPDHGQALYSRGEVVWSSPQNEDGNYRVGISLEKADLMGLSRILRTEP